MPPRPLAEGPDGERLQFRRNFFHQWNHFQIAAIGRLARSFSRFAAKQAVHVGQKHERIRFETAHHESGETVVVAEDGRARFLDDGFELGGGNRVVFIDDRKNTKAKQLFHGAPQIRIAAPIRKILFGEQHLRDFHVRRGEKVAIRVHEQALPHGGARLHGHDVVQSGGVQAEPAAPQAHGAGRNQDDLAALFHQFRNRAHDRHDAFRADGSIRTGHGARADFDHQSARGFQPFLSFRFHCGLGIAHGLQASVFLVLLRLSKMAYPIIVPEL